MQLETLDLSYNPLDERAWIALAQSPMLVSIKHLYLDRCHLSYRGLLALLESPYLGNLLTLSIAHNELSHQAQRLLLEHQSKLLGVERFCYQDIPSILHPQWFAEIEQTFHMCNHAEARQDRWSCPIYDLERMWKAPFDRHY